MTDMKTARNFSKGIFLFAFLLLAPLSSTGQEMEELLLFFEEEELIVSVTKQPQSLKKAPAVVTTLSGEQIRQMGARSLHDIIRRIPGMGLYMTFQGQEDIEVRGVRDNRSAKILILIDGHSVYIPPLASSTWPDQDHNLDNVKRVEIIRGPASALYGNGAFSAIINLITKEAKDMEGTTLSAGWGSFDRGEFNLQSGHIFGKVEAALTLDYLQTQGDRRFIEKDVLGNSGYTDEWMEKFDSQLKLSHGDFSFNSKYTLVKRGPYLGVAYAVNDESRFDAWSFFGDLRYKKTFGEKYHLTLKAYLDQLAWQADYEIFPENTRLGPFSYPEGMRGRPSLSEGLLGGEIQLDLQLTEENLLTLGVLREQQEQFETGHDANFDIRTGAPIPLSSFQDISAWSNWNQDKIRHVGSFYLQDLWDITPRLSLTLGLRRDDYSDFGETTNPRAALVWLFRKGWDLKLLYGTGLRAPGFEELYNINNPAVLGNEDLKPEETVSYEGSMGYTFPDKSHIRASYFRTQFTNKIDILALPSGVHQFTNTGGAKIDGVEFEVEKKLDEVNSLYGNYTYIEPYDRETGKRLADTPSHRGNLGLNYGISSRLRGNINIFMSSELPRIPGDGRNPLAGYALVDFSVIGKNFIKNVEIGGSVRNLFNHYYADPSPINTVEKDFPREGTTVFLQLTGKL